MVLFMLKKKVSKKTGKATKAVIKMSINLVFLLVIIPAINRKIDSINKLIKLSIKAVVNEMEVTKWTSRTPFLRALKKEAKKAEKIVSTIPKNKSFFSENIENGCNNGFIIYYFWFKVFNFSIISSSLFLIVG